MKRETRFVELRKALSDLLYDRCSMRLHLFFGQLAVEFGFVERGEVVVAGHEDFHQHDTAWSKATLFHIHHLRDYLSWRIQRNVAHLCH